VLVAPLLAAPASWAPIFLDELFGDSRTGSMSSPIILAAIIIMVVGAGLGLAWPFVVDGLRRLSETRTGSLFGVPRSPREHVSLLMFVVLLSATIGSYAYVYDGRGTVNPAWTGVFG
jgi:hypothetical protein